MFSIGEFVKKWAPGRQVSPLVKELFALVGKELTESDLAPAVDRSQLWLREKERWDIPVGRPSDLERLIALLKELGIGEPEAPAPYIVFDVAVLLGSTFRAMRHRLNGFLHSERRYKKLVGLGSVRPLIEQEVSEVVEYGEDPTNMDEAGAARLAIRLIMPFRADPIIICAPNQLTGERATTDDTIRLLAQQKLGHTYLFVSHQPFGPRQALTVTRCMNEVNADNDLHFLFAPLFALIEENPAILVDEVARTLWELNKLPDQYFG